MVVYTLGMAKKFKKTRKFLADFKSGNGVSPKARAVILPILVLIAAAAVIIGALVIIFVPKVNPITQRGVGANGFQAFLEPNGSLGVGDLVSKADVESALGNKSKVVSNAKLSKVFNIAGTRSQTATWSFVRADGVKASLYIDMVVFKNQPAFDNAYVTTGTLKAGTISDLPAYYMHAQTMGSDREYRLEIVKGLTVYKFVVAQPVRNITISEVAALASAKRLALKADLK
jgi:hypothetical protein